MEDDYQNQIDEEEEEETTEQILEEIAEGDDVDDDDELLQQSLLPTKKHHDISIQSLDQIKQIISFNQYDLIDAKGGLDLVIVNGDQLVAHFLRDSFGRNESNESLYRLDWSKHGGQLLHLTYLVETFVKNLLDRDMRIDIVFFEDIRTSQCIKSSFLLNLAYEIHQDTGISFQLLAYSFLVAKQAISSQLKKISETYSKSEVFTVTFLNDTWYKSSNWEKLITKRKPSFIISTLAQNSLIDELFCTESVLVRQLILTYDLCFYGNTVLGLCSAVRDNMTGSYKLREVEMFLEKTFSDERLENFSNLASQIGIKPEKQQLTEVKSTIEQIISKELPKSPISEKLSLSNLTLSTIASIDSLSDQTTPNSLALSKIFILTNIIQNIIPLKDRAQHIEDVSLDTSLISFQEKILTSLYHSIKQTNIEDNLHDLLDFRLFLKVLTILFESGVAQKLENNSSDDQILAELLPKDLQNLFKALASQLTSKSTKDASWWTNVLKPLVSTLPTQTEEYKPRHPECLLREILPFNQDVINGLVSDANITLPHKYEKKVEEQNAPVAEVEPVVEEDDGLEDWEKEDWLKDEEKVEEVVKVEEEEILTEQEAKELSFERCFPVREQEVNYSQKKDIEELIPNDFSGPKTDWEKIKVQEAQKRLHRYSESIRALSDKKVIENVKSSGVVVEEAKPTEQTKGGKPNKPNKKEEKQATPTATAAPSTKVRLMMIESNTKKREKEINELLGKLSEYQQKFTEYNNKADDLKEHGGKIEQYESLTKLLLEGVFKDIRLVQNIQATEGGSSSNKKGASSGSESFTAASLLLEQRTTCENLWVQLSILRLQFMTRKLLLERQDLQTSLRRAQSSAPKKGVKFLSFGDETSDDTKEKKDDKKKGALKESNPNAIPQIDNLSGGADLDLSLYWEPFELTNRIYEIVTQLIGDSYISELTLATSASQDKDKGQKAKPKKPVKGDKKAEKVKPITKIDLKDVIQTLINFMCDLGFVKFASRISEKFNQGEISFGSLIKENLLQQLDVETLPAETVNVKDAVNDKPESAEFQLLYNNAIIDAATNIEIPPAEIPETVSIESKGGKPKGHPKKEKPSRTKKDEKAPAEEDTTTEEPSTPVSQNYVMPTAKSLGFTPDPWQEEMILSILQNKSILVSAPTSSGKTFIAFFAIEKVLRESDDAIIVYCCPTKALVNQAYAEVYSRFQKVYSSTSPFGVSSMLGMYTSDEKINVTTCQVLITVPQSLEQLMTSPENLEWKRRMKYIILDEIHCINESAAGGQVWEHVLSLLECPFIALSASIGNPKEFADWLNENYNKEIVSHINYLNEQQQGVDLVVHDERPRPLEFYNYDTSSDRFTEIHPMATLNPNSIDTVTFSLIQNFSPLQCLTLFKVATLIRNSLKEQGKNVSNGVEKFLATFNPDSYFNNFGLFKRQQFSSYGKTMKEELIRLSTETDNHEFLLEIIRALLKDVSLSFDNMERDYNNQIQQPISDNVSESDAVSTTSSKIISRHKFGSEGWLKDNVIQLVIRLAEEKLIPSIFFSFDRTMCDYLLKKISTHLRSARANSQLGNYFHLYSSSLEKVRSEKEIRYSLQSIEQFGTKIPIELREALEVGVAVHHHNCPSEYLTEVERLFRLRCLPVVISTSTLALGIHMPCKTVVMVGHSIYLTTTMFQQCAGRSGRRGYDVKGRVVLYGIPQVAANRLLAGVTPKIKGAMGLRANFLLKMLTLLNKAKSDEGKYQIVSDDLSRLVNKKIFYLGQILNNSELQNRLCFRFILDFLRRNNYISEDGTLGEFSLLSNSLFYYEPANFLFIHLLKTGAINTYLQQWKDVLDQSPIRPEEKVELLGEKLLILLNLIFETRKLSHWDLSPYKLENYYANDTLEIITSSKAALNTNKNIASENVLSQLNDYNRMVLKEFTTFVVTYCKNYQDQTVDNVLPLSNITFPHEEAYLEQLYQESSICKSLNESKLKYYGTSSFVALSGNDDLFTSVSQLLNCRNHKVVLDISLLPYLDLVEKISQKSSLSISSYAVEFLRNGQKRQVSTDCDFPTLSLCFNSLKNFDRVLGQILYNIHLFMNIKNGANNDLFLATLTKLRTRFHDRVTGGKKTRKKLKMLKTINVEMDDLEMVNSKGKLKNSMKSTKKDAVTKETGSMME